MQLSLLFFLLFHTLSLQADANYPVSCTSSFIDDTHEKAIVSFQLNPQEILYKDSLSFSIDHPDLAIQTITPKQESVKRYDAILHETVHGYVDSPCFEITVEKKNSALIDPAHLHCMYHINKYAGPSHHTFLLSSCKEPTASLIQPMHKPSSIKESPEAKAASKTSGQWSWSETITSVLESTKSLPLRLILVFILGLMLSLTPCIYPMIPITVGILHAQKSGSFLGNFARAVCYTLGLATTFACFGLVASYTGPIYGKLLVHPISVLLIVSFLAYLAFSMFGFYEMHIPSFLNFVPKNRNGSFISAFLFGTASGTIASPCVSPGLILLLSIVATMGNLFLGFLLLFTFGVGLSMPLLLIGTFSSSINLLPQAGIWMLEVKKLFGILLLGVCFYYLSIIMPWHWLMLLIAFTMIAIGIMYFRDPYSLSLRWKKIKNLIGTVLIIGAMLALVESFQSWHSKDTTDQLWYTNYHDARTAALKENKKLFIDFWARYCSICKVINKGLLSDHAVREELKKYVVIKIDGTDETPDVKELKAHYGVIGYPAFIIADPQTECIEKRWSSELYHVAPDEFIQTLDQYHTK